MQIEVTTKNMTFLECFSSETRIQIIELLDAGPMNIKQLAERLLLSSAIVTKHIQKLENAGIVSCKSIAGRRGTQKICSLQLNQAVLQFKTRKQDVLANTISIPVGQYSAFDVKPACGMASRTQIIGLIDDPRYFADPQHVQANHLWFSSGFVEYRIPNFLNSNQKLRSLEISLEICSEASGCNETWPSDIHFYINDVPIGMWTCQGDFGKQKGAYTPDWHNCGTQYGVLKIITVNERGSYLDGIRIADVTSSDLGMAYGKDVSFRIASLEDAQNCGGINLFGKHFGSYNQDIEITMHYNN
ncbi:ArsR/SmtB family transcription factor [Paenibacillus solisilvae]|uniref:ArsR/SmtB family transcription factor n=1 Tax=Paenibacillus solisilvae TaxID=2486751 RepID=A0ABW0W427_9BACL